MNQVLLFENLDPWQMDLRRDSRGRFAGGGGGGGGGGMRVKRSATGRKKATVAPMSSRVAKRNAFKNAGYGRHTQKVSGTVNGRKKSVKVESTTKTIRGAKKGQLSTAYVYKVKRGGVIGKAPKNSTAGHAVGATSLNKRFKPGTPIGGKNVRYLSRGHIAGRAIPTHTTAGIGRALSANAVRRAKKGKPLAPGYVVSYGAPLP